MGSTVSISNEVLDGLLGELRLPLLVVNEASIVVWMNPAADLFTGSKPGDGVGRPLVDVVGIAPEDRDRMAADRRAALEWRTFQAPSADAEGRILTVQRKQIPMPGEEPLYALILEGAGWWEEPDLRRLSGSRILYFETDADGVLLRGVESFTETLGRPAGSAAILIMAYLGQLQRE